MNRQCSHRKNGKCVAARVKRGFTLIELLVVVAIIALLIAILLPSLAAASKQAKSARCLANLRGMGMAAQMYTSDYACMLPYAGSGDSKHFWVNTLRPYGQVNNMRICPEALTIGSTPSTATTSWSGGSAGTDPTTGKAYYGSYCINCYVISTKNADSSLVGYAAQGLPSGSPAPDASYFWSFPFQASASDIPVFSDGVWYDAWPHAQDTAPLSTQRPAFSDSEPHMHRLAANRHSMAANVSFLDGHADHVKLPNLWTLKWNTKWGTALEVIPRPLPKMPTK